MIVATTAKAHATDRTDRGPKKNAGMQARNTTVAAWRSARACRVDIVESIHRMRCPQAPQSASPVGLAPPARRSRQSPNGNRATPNDAITTPLSTQVNIID